MPRRFLGVVINTYISIRYFYHYPETIHQEGLCAKSLKLQFKSLGFHREVRLLPTGVILEDAFRS